MYRTEKQARECTVASAGDIAKKVLAEKRQYTAGEAQRVDRYLREAESLNLGTDIPRDPAKLVAYAHQPARKLTAAMAALIDECPKPKGLVK